MPSQTWSVDRRDNQALMFNGIDVNEFIDTSNMKHRPTLRKFSHMMPEGERAQQYLHQAPVIFQACQSMQPRQVARYLEKCDRNGVKLKPTLRGLKIHPCFRKFTGKIAKRTRGYDIIRKTHDIPVSIVAQSLDRIEGQEHEWNWVDNVTMFWNGSGRRIDVPVQNGDGRVNVDYQTMKADRLTHTEWFMKQRQQVVAGNFVTEIRHMCDFIRADDRQDFDPRWNWEQAYIAAERWVAEMNADSERKYIKAQTEKYGVSEVSYAPAPHHHEIEGITFRAMTTPLDFAQEGDAMRHCIRSYWGNAANGDSIFYHVEGFDETMKRIRATLQLSKRQIHVSDAPHFTVHQLHSFANAPPDIKIEKATALFTRHINALHKDEFEKKKRDIIDDDPRIGLG
ncbi:MAG: PcfJ domain-containing protein [Pseudomonadota bacterium]